MKTYFHATDLSNLGSILEKGLEVRNIEGIIYLCDTPHNAMKFLRVRGYKDILVIEVEVDESKVEEQFDHNEAFFKCKAYGYPENIPIENCIGFKKYSF